MAGPVHGEEQIEGRALATRLPVSLIQPLVAVLSATPDLVLDRTMYVVLRIGLNDKEPSSGRGLIELYGVVVVFHLQLIEYRMRRVRC